jgi:creatinine amidohydrolase
VPSASPTIAVLPLGATEQHGPHLPFETDTIIAENIAKRVEAQIPDSINALFLDVEPVGYSPEHMDFAGSKSLSFDEAINRWIGIGETMHKRGISKFLMLNAHGGNSPLMTIVAQELRVQFDMLAVATSWTRFIKQSPVISLTEQAIGIHGGEIETSVMLVLAPDLVNIEKAENFPSLQEKLIENHQHLRAYGPHAFGWKMGDLNPQGVVGNAAIATAETGEALLEMAVSGIVELVVDLDEVELSQLIYTIAEN